MNFTPSLAPELAGLPTPQVLETLRFETVFDALLRDFQVRYPQYSALLASDPAIKLIEVAAYRELLLRSRINEAARANLLAFAVGNDLEHLGAFYGVSRLPQEQDEPLRRRIRARIMGFANAGGAAHYRYWALSASPEVAHVAGPRSGAHQCAAHRAQRHRAGSAAGHGARHGTARRRAGADRYRGSGASQPGAGDGIGANLALPRHADGGV